MLLYVFLRVRAQFFCFQVAIDFVFLPFKTLKQFFSIGFLILYHGNLQENSDKTFCVNFFCFCVDKYAYLVEKPVEKHIFVSFCSLWNIVVFPSISLRFCFCSAWLCVRFLLIFLMFHVKHFIFNFYGDCSTWNGKTPYLGRFRRIFA